MVDAETRKLRSRYRDWPHIEHSNVVRAAGLLWHVQTMGDGPPVLLIHGTGAATHSFRDLMPLLATRFKVTSIDLPGHGFTEKPSMSRLSLRAMAKAVAELLACMEVKPVLVVGHSAGAAVLCQMCHDRSISPRLLISLNGALMPFEGMAGATFAPAAKLIALNPLLPYLVAWRARFEPQVIETLIKTTGSKMDDTGLGLYRRVVSQPRHVAAAIGMMARWDLGRLQELLPDIETRIILIVGMLDGLIKPGDAERVSRLLHDSEIIRLEGLGHVAHEEDPEQIASLIFDKAGENHVLPGQVA